MTDNWREFVAYYAVLVGVSLTALLALAVAVVLVAAGVELAVKFVMWLAENPRERDITTIAALALVALAAAEWRRR